MIDIFLFFFFAVFFILGFYWIILNTYLPLIIGSVKYCIESFLNQDCFSRWTALQLIMFRKLNIRSFLDPQLNFSVQINYICKKIGKKLGYFRRISSFFVTMDYNFGLQYYCITPLQLLLFFVHFRHSGKFCKLQLHQNKTMRIILGYGKYTPI